MGRLLGQHITWIRSIHPEYDCKVYVETGLLNGDQLSLSSPYFEVAHGIELNNYYYEITKARMAPAAHVRVHRGDSRILLPEILEPYADQTCFFYLDAHYFLPIVHKAVPKTEFPLWTELDIIRKRKVRDIIVIDDADLFGKDRPDLKFSETSKDWESVTGRTLLDFFGNQAQDSLTVRDTFVLWKAGT